MLESVVTRQILRWLNSIDGVRAVKTQGASHNAGEPDVTACWRVRGAAGTWEGQMVLIEVKVPGELPRRLQEQVAALWREAGAIAIWATSLQEVQRELARHGLVE